MSVVVHGHAGRGRRTPSYNSWRAMKSRCYYPAHPFFSEYGGRGIRVCDDWQIFDGFLADMGERPSLRHSIDRIDVNGHYEPQNCRWATLEQQRWNRRDMAAGPAWPSDEPAGSPIKAELFGSGDPIDGIGEPCPTTLSTGSPF